MYNVKVIIDRYCGEKDDPNHDNARISGSLANELKDYDVSFETATLSKTQHKLGSLVIYQNEKYITILRVYVSALLDNLFDFKFLHEQVYKLLKHNDKVLLILEADELGIYSPSNKVILNAVGYDLGYPIRILPSAHISSKYNTITYLKHLIIRITETDLDDLYTKSKPVIVMDENPLVDYYNRAGGIGQTLAKRIIEKYPSIIDLLNVRKGKIVIVEDWNENIKGVGEDKKIALEKLIFGDRKQKQYDLVRFMGADEID